MGYVGAMRVCADVTLNRLRENAALVDGGVDEVVLLTSRPDGRTLYRAGSDRGVILPLANLVRRTGDPLTVRGQLDGSGQPLVWLKGLDLIDTVCDPARVLNEEDCRNGRPSVADDGASASFDRRWEMTSLALVDDARIARLLRETPGDMAGVTERGPRAYCVRLVHVSGLELANLGFEDCWLTAIHAVNSRNLSVSGSRFHGSTFGFLAVATGGMAPDNHSYELTGNHWLQSPAAYRPEAGLPCDALNLDLGCAPDIWSELPWGVTHHHIWRPLNGAFFAGYNIAGNVLIADNLLEHAYNGIRVIAELPGTGRNVEVRGNLFRFIRDNAVEPEDRADGWVVKNNRFQNVHAWLSTDGVAGGSMYVFGNLGWHDLGALPGQDCDDEVNWSISPRLDGLAGDKARYLLLDVSDEPSAIACDGHRRGTIIKTGDKRRSGFPYFEWISIFNNSWRTRSPLFSSKHASPLSHFNNAISFLGCGLHGPPECRQVPAPVGPCRPGNKRTRGAVGAQQFWTEDGEALIADCFTFTPGPAEPDPRVEGVREVAHRFCRDVMDRGVNLPVYGEGACALEVSMPLFIESGPGSLDLANPVIGCRPVYERGVVMPDCGDSGPRVGAIQPPGTLFEMEIPGAGFVGEAFRP